MPDVKYNSVKLTSKGEAYIQYMEDNVNNPDRLDIEKWSTHYDQEQGETNDS